MKPHFNIKHNRLKNSCNQLWHCCPSWQNNILLHLNVPACPLISMRSLFLQERELRRLTEFRGTMICCSVRQQPGQTNPGRVKPWRHKWTTLILSTNPQTSPHRDTSPAHTGWCKLGKPTQMLRYVYLDVSKAALTRPQTCPQGAGPGPLQELHFWSETSRSCQSWHWANVHENGRLPRRSAQYYRTDVCSKCSFLSSGWVWYCDVLWVLSDKYEAVVISWFNDSRICLGQKRASLYAKMN